MLVPLRAAEVPSIDMILLDCLLPAGDLAVLFAEADRRCIAVVLISGDPRQAEPSDLNRRFLAKPLTQKTLLTMLDTARR